jgi:hypothetical protein
MTTVFEKTVTVQEPVTVREPVGEWIFDPKDDSANSARWVGGPENEPERPVEEPNVCSIALLGDGTVSCEYFPPANRPENHLMVRLSRAFPEQRFVVRNLATPGETPGSFLGSGKLEKIKELLPQLHLVFVRYNLDEADPRGVKGCIEDLAALGEALRRQYPGVTMILETGIWVHNTAPFGGDSYARLAPLYDQVRGWAMEVGYPIVDIYTKMQTEANKGSKDLRVRGLPTWEQTVLDDSFDEFFGDEPVYFANIHPNSRCLGLIAEWEVTMIKNLARKS